MERFFALSLDLFCVAGFDGFFRELNPRWSETLGYSIEELKAKPFLDFLHPDDRAATEAEAARIGTGATTLHFENRYRCRDGSYRWLEWSAVPYVAEELIYAVARDVTEQRSATAILERVEADHRHLFDHSHDLVQAVGADGHFLYVNPAWVEALGHEADKVSSLSFRDVVHPDDLPHCNEVFASLAQAERTEVVHLRLRTKRGGVISVEGSVSSRVAQGELAATLGVFRNVTGRLEAEATLRRTSELLRVITDAQAQFIAGSNTHEVFDVLLDRLLELTDSEYGFIGELDCGEDGVPLLKTHSIASTAWDDETRRSFEERAGESLVLEDSSTLHGETVNSREAVIANDLVHESRPAGQLPGQPPLRAFLGLPLVKGTTLVGTICVANRPGGYDDAMVRYLQPFLATCANIVEAQRAELQRQRSEVQVSEGAVRLRAVVETAVDAIITIDEKGTIENANPATTQLFGYQVAELVDRNVRMLMPDPYQSEHDGYLRRYKKTRERRIIGIGREVLGLRKDGSEFPIELAVSEMEFSDRRLFTGVIRDISERKKVERLKDEFVSTVSHELRTPLTSIRGALGLVAGGAVGELPEKAGAMIDIALTNSERLIRLINDILDVEKIGTGRMTFALEPVDIGEAARQAIVAHHGYAEQFQTHFVMSEAQPGVMVMADRDRLAQVLANLMSNAAKHSPAGEPVEISLHTAHGRVEVSVRDHGPGVPEEFRPRLFSRFMQADASDSRKRGGTGLGLNIAKAIVERLGGRIGFEPAPERGSRFYFVLPQWVEESAQASGLRVLVCEDDPDVARLLRETLQSHDFAVDSAHDIASALTLLDRHEYHAITLDLSLGSDDGLSLLRQIREGGPHQSVPVVVVSARASEERELAGGVVDVVDWIDKPVDETRLSAALAEALSSNRPAHILHVEDDADIRRVIHATLADMASVTAAGTLKEARAHLEVERFDLVLLDLGLPDGGGEELLSEIGTTPVVIFSASDLAPGMGQQVAAALVKSRTSDDELRDTICRLISSR